MEEKNLTYFPLPPSHFPNYQFVMAETINKIALANAFYSLPLCWRYYWIESAFANYIILCALEQLSVSGKVNLNFQVHRPLILSL